MLLVYVGSLRTVDLFDMLYIFNMISLAMHAVKNSCLSSLCLSRQWHDIQIFKCLVHCS